VTTRREVVLDAAISVLGTAGMHGLTHRSVDAAAGLPAGSTSNLFRTRDALLDAVVERFADRERANWEEIAARTSPTNPRELAEALTAFVKDATGPNRTLTLARYAILVEAAVHPPLRAQLLRTGGRVNDWFTNWVRTAGSTRPELDAPIIMNYGTGVVLHDLAMPDPAFDPSDQLMALVTSVINKRHTEAEAQR
jgi:DNA-binding transcriptional regulator YbjK